MESLLSGLAGAIVGAVLGVVGTLANQWRQDRNDDQAAARATYMEVMAAVGGLNFNRQFDLYHPIATSTWASARLHLARRLPPMDFMIVATFYTQIEGINALQIPRSGGGVGSVKDTVEQAYAVAPVVLRILGRYGWGKREQKFLDETINETLSANLEVREQAPTVSPAPEHDG